MLHTPERRQVEEHEMLFINCDPQRNLSSRDRFLEEAQKKSHAAVAAHRNRLLTNSKNYNSIRFIAQTNTETQSPDRVSAPEQLNRDSPPKSASAKERLATRRHFGSLVETNQGHVPAVRRHSEFATRLEWQQEFVQQETPSPTNISSCSSDVMNVDDSADYDASGFAYFVAVTLPQISGLDDRTFWNDTLIPVAVSDQGLKHALSALGLLHRSWSLRCESGSMVEVASYRTRSLEQYCKAIQALTTNQHTSKLVMMLAVIVFIAVEMLTDAPHRGARHYFAGVAMAQDWSSLDQGCNEKKIFEESILPILQRLLLHFGSADDPQPPVHYYKRNPDKTSPSPLEGHVVCLPRSEADYVTIHTLPAVFVDVVDSSRALRQITRAITYRTKIQLREKVIRKHHAKYVLSDALALVWAWRSRFEQLLVLDEGSMDKKSLALASYLEAYFNFLVIQLNTVCSPDELIFDAYESEFRMINTLCRRCLTLEGEAIGRDPHRPIFRFESCMLPMISFSANRCRHPSIRRDSIAILESFHLVESIIPSSKLAMWSRRLVELEESGCDRIPQISQDVPKQSRVQSLDMSFASRPTTNAATSERTSPTNKTSGDLGRISPDRNEMQYCINEDLQTQSCTMTRASRPTNIDGTVQAHSRTRSNDTTNARRTLRLDM